MPSAAADEDAVFAAIVRSSQDAVIAKTPDGVVTAWNDGATAVYGFTAEQMLGRSIEVTFSPDRLAEERLRHARVAAGASESGYRCTRIRSDGSAVEVVMSMSPVRDADGRVTGIASISRPVSVAEQSDSRFAALLDAAPDAMVVVGLDGRIVAVNAQVGAMFGYEREELLGNELEVLLPEGLRERHVAHRTSYARDPRVRAMGTGLSLHARRRDGSTFPVEISLAPHRSGGEGLVIAAVRDVSEHRALELDARENASRLRQLAESVDVVFLLLQLDPEEYLYISPNAERIFGMPMSTMLVEGEWGRVVHPDDRDALHRDFYVPSRAGLPATALHRVVGLDGTARWFRTIASPVPNPDGPVRRTVITSEDVTETVLIHDALRAAELEARSANDAKNVFLSRMSHELRTPLNAILGFGQLLSRQLTGSEHHEAIGHILRGGRHLLDLINDVLDIARIESGQMSLSREPVSVAEIVEETLQLMEPLAAAAEVSLTVVSSEPSDFVQVDRQRMRQILLNLVSNAIKYNRPGGKVWVDWSAEGDRITLTVRDDGQGIPPELQSRLFTPFDRLGAEGTSVEGTGIGLALTRSLSELMGGSISVTSAPGEGACFTVSLPRASAPTSPDLDGTLRQVVPPTQPGRPPSRVLYIEDNEPNVKVVEHIVRLRPDWRLVHAGLGRLGLDLARAHHPDLILLDLHLPDMTGREVLSALRGHPATRHTPVAILTADASSGQPVLLKEAGADHFLTKPLDLDDVLRLLDDVAARAEPAEAG